MCYMKFTVTLANGSPTDYDHQHARFRVLDNGTLQVTDGQSGDMVTYSPSGWISVRSATKTPPAPIGDQLDAAQRNYLAGPPAD